MTDPKSAAQAADQPAKPHDARARLVPRIRRGVGILRAQWALRGCELGHWVCVDGPVHLENHGHIRLGSRVTFVGGMLPTSLVCHPGGLLEVGGSSLFNYGASVEVHGRVRIGERCMFASYVRLCDLTPSGRIAPIEIGDDVWVAHGAIVSAGVSIGEGSVVSAGSVVVGDVPPHSLAIGNPARIAPLDLVARRNGT